MRHEPRVGDEVTVPWGLDDAPARVRRVYGPAGHRHALVEVDLGDAFDADLGREVETTALVSVPLSSVRTPTAA